MSYSSWCQNHGAKHQKLVSYLRECGLDKEAVTAYFEYDCLSKKQPGFCPLFARGQKCHDTKYLNCYFCGCPFFVFSSDLDAPVQSRCAVHSRFGVQKRYNGKEHLDCSGCIIPHTYQFVRKNFTYNWFDAMKMCKKETKE